MTGNGQSVELDESPSPDHDGKNPARRITTKIRAADPKRRWGAFTAVVTATTGLAVGWVVRRGRRRKLPWRR